jgi:polyisoprenoid-binding protein YceI
VRVRLSGFGIALLVLGLAAALAGCQATYAPQPAEGVRSAPGTLEFVGRNRLATARGTFHRWSFRRIELDREHPERGVVELEVDVASIDTGIERRDEHLRSADFFDVEKFPTATIRVENAVADGTGEAGRPRFRARFVVRIRDVEKPIDGHFEVVSESPPAVEGDVVLNRTDFGVGPAYRWWNPASIRNEIPIHFATPVQ